MSGGWLLITAITVSCEWWLDAYKCYHNILCFAASAVAGDRASGGALLARRTPSHVETGETFSCS